jgi:putative NADH-flavin reductase
MTKIGVFPASGGLGRSVVNHLTKLVRASQLILIARKPGKLTEFDNAGATVRHADYDSPETLKTAFEGVDVLMLISYASFEIEHRVKVSTHQIIGNYATNPNRFINWRLTLPSAAASSTSSTRRWHSPA